MRVLQLLSATFAAAVVVNAQTPAPAYSTYANPYANRDLYVPRRWVDRWNKTYESFVAGGEVEDAGKVRRLQKEAATFIWIDSEIAVSSFNQRGQECC
jgi:hypothetical protein